MEAWVLHFYLNVSKPSIDMQSEDACVRAAKVVSSTLPYPILCINTFTGEVLAFRDGKQI